MLGLTPEERKIILFLISIGLIGLGIKFISINKPCIGEVIRADNLTVRMDINKASLQELSCAERISQKLAKKIIEYRRVHGPFDSIDELKEIKGIGEYRLRKLKDLFFVE